MKWQTPITDRTAADILARTGKAFFNLLDWARVYGNAQIVNRLARALLAMDVHFTELSQPVMTDFPTADDVNSLSGNIDAVRASMALPAATGILSIKHDYQAGAGGSAPDYQAVNAWELDSEIARNLLLPLAQYQIYCGVGTSGQPRFWQNQFRRRPLVPDAATPVRRARTGVATAGTGLIRNNLFRRYS